VNVSILPIGGVDTDILLMLVSKLGERFGSITMLPSVEAPEDACSHNRGQHDSARFLEIAQEACGERVLGVTSLDLFAPGLNFVFGRALLGGRGCVISIARLQHPDSQIVAERIVKEAIHELGHTLGLDHCKNTRCVMFFSNSIADTDGKGDRFCGRCGADLERTDSL
jgi:archaemetzincin